MAAKTIITWTRGDGSTYSKTEYNRISEFGRATEVRKATNRGETVVFEETEMAPVPATRKEIKVTNHYVAGKLCPRCHTYCDGDCRN